MARTLKDKLAVLDPARRAGIEAEADRIVYEKMSNTVRIIKTIVLVTAILVCIALVAATTLSDTNWTSQHYTKDIEGKRI